MKTKKEYRAIVGLFYKAKDIEEATKICEGMKEILEGLRTPKVEFRVSYITQS